MASNPYNTLEGYQGMPNQWYAQNNNQNPYNTMGGYQQMQPQVYTPQAQPTALAAPTSGGNAQAAANVTGSVGGILGGLGQLGLGIGQTIKGNKQRKKYEALVEQELNNMPEYTTSPYAVQQLASAQSQTNAVNPAIAMMQRQNQQLAANTAAVGQRNAMSGAEAINAAALGQNLAQQQNPMLAQMQTQYEMANRANLYSALQNMTNERTNAFNSKSAKNDRFYNQRLGQLGAANNKASQGVANIFGGFNSAQAERKQAMKDVLSMISKGGM